MSFWHVFCLYLIWWHFMVFQLTLALFCQFVSGTNLCLIRWPGATPRLRDPRPFTTLPLGTTKPQGLSGDNRYSLFYRRAENPTIPTISTGSWSLNTLPVSMPLSTQMIPPMLQPSIWQYSMGNDPHFKMSRLNPVAPMQIGLLSHFWLNFAHI